MAMQYLFFSQVSMNSQLGGGSVVDHAEPDMTKFQRHTNDTLFNVCDYLVPLVCHFQQDVGCIVWG